MFLKAELLFTYSTETRIVSFRRITFKPLNQVVHTIESKNTAIKVSFKIGAFKGIKHRLATRENKKPCKRDVCRVLLFIM